MGKPAAIVSCLEGRWPRRIAVAHCAALGEALAALHLAAADFTITRANALSFAGWQSLFEGCRGKADAVEPGLEAEIAGGSRGPRAPLAARPAGRRDPRRPVPGQRVLRRRAGHRHHRLLLRLQRPARLRRRDLPERLVLRDRRLVQPDQGAGPAAGLPPPAAALPGRGRGPAGAGARLGPALPDDPALRLAAPGRGRQGHAQGPARISDGSSASIAASPARRPTVCHERDSRRRRSRGDPHRRRLQRQSRPGRLGGDPGLEGQAPRAVAAASR